MAGPRPEAAPMPVWSDGIETGDSQVDNDRWDAGHNQGLAARKGGDPPAYYAESGAHVRYAKAVGMAFAAIVPYYLVTDQLGGVAPDSFIPCNGQPCHYTRLFSNRHLPGTGPNVMSVQNGVSRPVAMDYFNFDSIPCPSRNSPDAYQRNYTTKLWGKPCPVHSSSVMKRFYSIHNGTAAEVDKESRFAHRFSFPLRLSFWMAKAPLVGFIVPFNMVAKLDSRWGMDNVPNGRCPNMTRQAMRKMCASVSVKQRISNHLSFWNAAKVTTVATLFLWAAMCALHDVLLLYGVSEMVTLRIGVASTFMQGLAVSALFIWAKGATGVFVAELEGRAVADCVCYFKLPEILTLVTLATPFMLLAAFAAKVQMTGMAALFGDYTYYQRYDAPHYLAKQSYLWSWAVLITPKMAGSILGRRREEFAPADWVHLFQLQQMLFYWRLVVINGFVALCGSAYMVSCKELLVTSFLHPAATPVVKAVLKYCLLPAPSIIAWTMGLFAVVETWFTCIEIDEGETFADQVNNMVPHILGGKCMSDWLRKRPTIETCLAKVSFIVITLVVLALTFAVGHGLCPDLNFLLGLEGTQPPSLAQAELWGACGFIFVGLHVQKGVSYVFSTWDDMESMKNLGNASTNGGAYMYEQVDTHCAPTGLVQKVEMMARDSSYKPL